MRHYTHPSGCKATVETYEVGCQITYFRADGRQYRALNIETQGASKHLESEGYKDDEAEDAARFRFILAAMCEDSPEHVALGRASEDAGPIQPNDPVELRAKMLHYIDEARAALAGAAA